MNEVGINVVQGRIEQNGHGPIALCGFVETGIERLIALSNGDVLVGPHAQLQHDDYGVRGLQVCGWPTMAEQDNEVEKQVCVLVKQRGLRRVDSCLQL